MDRRRFVTGASIGVAAATSFPMPAVAQGARELKMVTTWPKTLPGLQSSAERVAQSITALSGGRLQVKMFAAGQLVSAFESFEAVSSGLADMYHSSEITWASRSPAYAYFCNVPFGLTANEINAWIYHGGGQALWDELSAGFGLKSMIVHPASRSAIDFTLTRARRLQRDAKRPDLGKSSPSPPSSWCQNTARSGNGRKLLQRSCNIGPA